MRVRSLTLKAAALQKNVHPRTILRALKDKKQGLRKANGPDPRRIYLDPASIERWQPRSVGRPAKAS